MVNDHQSKNSGGRNSVQSTPWNTVSASNPVHSNEYFCTYQAKAGFSGLGNIEIDRETYDMTTDFRGIVFDINGGFWMTFESGGNVGDKDQPLAVDVFFQSFGRGEGGNQPSLGLSFYYSCQLRSLPSLMPSMMPTTAPSGPTSVSLSPMPLQIPSSQPHLPHNADVFFHILGRGEGRHYSQC